MEDFEEFQDYDESRVLVYFSGKLLVSCLCRLIFYVSLLRTLMLLLKPMDMS
jgi:hypothetical protein